MFAIILSGNGTVMPIFHWLTKVIHDYPSFQYFLTILILMGALVLVSWSVLRCCSQEAKMKSGNIIYAGSARLDEVSDHILDPQFTR